MPTLLLVDASLSLVRPVSAEDISTTRQDLVQRGILHFLQFLQECHPLEPVSLVTFSSTCCINVPFTRDHSQLRRALYDYHLRDCSDVNGALAFAGEYLRKSCGDNMSGVQVVLIVDGCPLPETRQSLCGVAMPHGVRVHCVAIGNADELKGTTPYCELTRKWDGDFFITELPTQARSFKHVFDQLAKIRYIAYVGSLALGHLTCSVVLYPDPNLGKKHVQFASPSMESKDIEIPSILAIRGVVSMAELGAVTITTKYSITIPSAEIKRRSVMTFGSEETHSNEVLVMQLISQGLLSEKTAGVVPLSTIHTALLIPSSTELLLCVLADAHPGGNLSSLSCIGNGRVALGVEPHPFQPPDALEFPLSEAAAQNDFNRLQRLLRGLPAKKEQLHKECEKICRTGAIYGCPSYKQKLYQILTASKNEVPPAHTVFISELIRQYVNDEKEKDKPKISSAASALQINNLLN